MIFNRFLAATLLGALALGGCAVKVTPRSMVYQDKTPIALAVPADTVAGAVIAPLSLGTPDGATLAGIEMTVEGAKANVVFYAGNGMTINKAKGILAHFAKVPVNLVWFDYRGSGASSQGGELSVDNLKGDALAVFDLARQRLPQGLPVLVNGLSMGTLLAPYVASERQVDGIVLDGAIESVPTLVDNMVSWWNKPFVTVTVAPQMAALDNKAILKTLHQPILFLEGEDDTTTPPAMTQRLYEASAAKVKILTLLPGIDHAQPMTTDRAVSDYQQFIAHLGS
ncbi:alpha/beta hydrolase [Gallaecimonas pentaromativorans]|uniref:alpha/beta hydrolase n=1 Tax=Gallaecimonas pentaromativorans TaxID=584787 RepID=UPI003A8FDF6D